MTKSEKPQLLEMKMKQKVFSMYCINIESIQKTPMFHSKRAPQKKMRVFRDIVIDVFSMSFTNLQTTSIRPSPSTEEKFGASADISQRYIPLDFKFSRFNVTLTSFDD